MMTYVGATSSSGFSNVSERFLPNPHAPSAAVTATLVAQPVISSSSNLRTQEKPASFTVSNINETTSSKVSAVSVKYPSLTKTQTFEEDYDLRLDLWHAIKDYCEKETLQNIYLKYPRVKDRLGAYIEAARFFCERQWEKRGNVTTILAASKGVHYRTMSEMMRNICFFKKLKFYTKVLAERAKAGKDDFKEDSLYD